MSEIRRFGAQARWSDVVVHAGVARWVEVAADVTQDADSQIAQVLRQVDETLEQLGCDRTRLLEVLVYLADRADAQRFNQHWDAWVPSGEAPVRACLQAGLADGCRVELVITAALHTP